MVKYLIFGNGYVGQYLQRTLTDGDDVAVISDMRVDTTADVSREIETYEPDVVINCVGKTGTPNVDWCERNKVVTYNSNVVVARVMGVSCMLYDTRLIHISTGCVFEGDGPFDDNDTPNFSGSFYSRTKRMAEDLLSELPDTTCLRIRLPISEDANDKNFLVKAMKYDKVTDIKNSITFLKDLSECVKLVVRDNIDGNINVVHPQVTSVTEIVAALGRTDIPVTTQEELQLGARANTILKSSLLQSKGFNFVNFDEELFKCVEVLNNEKKM